jgi:toxin ParE1/3/4
MKHYKVGYLIEFFDQLDRIEAYLEGTGSSAQSAERHVVSVKAYCETMTTFPYRGTPRDDLLPGLLMTHYKGDTILAYTVDEKNGTVWFVGVFFGGQNHEMILTSRFGH